MASMSIMMMFTLMTPTKMSLLLILNSLMISAMSYMTTNSIFCAMSVVLSFSSGMMILLCYTTTLSNFEVKNKSNPTITLCLIIMCTVMTSNMWAQPSSQLTQGSVMMSTCMPMMMMVLILSMVKTINQALNIHLSKSMMSSF